jgi:hypothetical protein
VATATKGETKTVIGTIGAVGKVNDFGFANIKVETAGGDEWVSSKVPGLIAAARNAVGETRAVDYVETEGKINQKTGKPYINRYLEAVRQPAADEVPAFTGDDDIPFGQADETPLEVTVQQEVEAFGGSRVNGSQDEFRRSKEEMRWTEALHIAAALFGGSDEVGTAVLRRTAQQIYDIIAAGPQADDGIPY